MQKRMNRVYRGGFTLIQQKGGTCSTCVARIQSVSTVAVVLTPLWCYINKCCAPNHQWSDSLDTYRLDIICVHNCTTQEQSIAATEYIQIGYFATVNGRYCGLFICQTRCWYTVIIYSCRGTYTIVVLVYSQYLQLPWYLHHCGAILINVVLLTINGQTAWTPTDSFQVDTTKPNGWFTNTDSTCVYFCVLFSSSQEARCSSVM